MLSPLNPSTYSTLGYKQTLTGDLTNTMRSFHKALGTEMFTLVIEQLMNCVAPFPGFPDTTPWIPSLLISPKSSSRECSTIMEDDSMSPMYKTL